MSNNDKEQTIEYKMLYWMDRWSRDKVRPMPEHSAIDMDKFYTHQIISIVRADERKRIREGIEKLCFATDVYNDTGKLIEYVELDDVNKICGGKE